MKDELDVTPPFSRDDAQVIERDSPYQGFFRLDRIRLRHRLYEGGWSKELTRELFVRHQAMAVLPYDPVRHTLLMVEQFRVGALDWRDSPWCLELIAGIADVEGETLHDLVRREAREEAGVQLGELVPISSYMPSPGGTDERLHLFLARADLSDAGGVHGNPGEGEDIRALVLDADAIPALLDSGRVDNAASQIALHWFLVNGEYWRRQWLASEGAGIVEP